MATADRFFVWSDSISLGIPLIDHDHQYLVELINQLHEAVGRGDEREILETVLDALVDYAVYHFGREERVMEACGVPEVAKHHRHHEAFARKIADVQQRFRDDRDGGIGPDVLYFLKQWLEGHILGEDVRMREHVAGNPAAEQAAAMVPRLALQLPVGSGVPTLDWQKLSVLLIDGNAGFRKVLSTILSTVNPQAVREAAGGAEALEILRGFTPNVVVCDWFLDDMEVAELIGRARSSRDALAGVPFLVLLGYEARDLAATARAAGADEILDKPLTAKRLLMAVAAAATDGAQTS